VKIKEEEDENSNNNYTKGDIMTQIFRQKKIELENN